MGLQSDLDALHRGDEATRIADVKEKAKQKAEAEKQAKLDAQKRAAEQRERDELARLQSKYPTA